MLNRRKAQKIKLMLSYYKTVAQCERMCGKFQKQIENMSNKIAKIRGFKNFEKMQNYYIENKIDDEFCKGVWGALGNLESMYENCNQ